tara:strand:- start:27 stop:155 length:129 start_codon:yes stop_codon:yes gene_type:complete
MKNLKKINLYKQTQNLVSQKKQNFFNPESFVLGVVMFVLYLL